MRRLGDHAGEQPVGPGVGPQAAHGADVLRATLRGEPTQRPPVIFLGGPWVGRQAGYPAERLLTDPHALADAQRRAHEAVGQDAVLAYFDPLFIPEAYGCRLRFLDTGALASEIPLADVWTRSPDVGDGRLPVILQAIGLLAMWSAGSVAVGTLFEGPLTTLSRVSGTETVLRLTIRDPDTVEAALHRVTEVLARFARAAFSAGADFLVVADPVGSATMISGPMYRRFALPALRRLFDEMPGPAVLHVCGDTSPILELMDQTGAAALSLDQCMDLRRARALVGEQCVLGGNVDPLTLLTGTPEHVRTETRAAIAAGGGRRHIVMPGCGVPPGAPLENVAAMVAATRVAGDNTRRL